MEISERAAETARLVGDEIAAVIARRHGHPEQGLQLLDTWQMTPGPDSLYTINQHADTRGSIWLMMGRPDEAIGHYRKAVELAESKNARMQYSEHLAWAYEQNGNLAEALATYKEFHLLHCQVASEAAQRNARVAAVHLETEEAKASVVRLERLCQEDPLTGLANRRRLDDLLATGAYAVALVDVDHFKRVNDQFSHQTGDEVLRELAALLTAACRTDDVAARFGGEEFAVLFQTLPAPELLAAAERIRTVETFDRNRLAEGLSITVSVGVTAAGETPLLALADQRLYEAKHTGRNRVVGALSA